jgi:hypothetical protein
MKQMVEEASCTWCLQIREDAQDVEEEERTDFPAQVGSSEAMVMVAWR